MWKMSRAGRLKISRGLKRAWRRNSYRQRWSASWQHNRSKNIRILSRNMTKAWRNPELRSVITNGMRGVKRSRLARENIRKAHNTPIVKRHHSKASKRLWRRKSHREIMIPVLDRIHYEMRGRFTSAIQKWSFWSLVHRFGKGLRLNYRVGSKICDVACPRLTTVFELDGAYWHQDKSHMRKRDKYLNSRGWKVFHFPACKRHQKETVLEILDILKVMKEKLS